MSEQIKQSLFEKEYEKPKGLDIRIRSFYLRHAEKAEAGIDDDIAISKNGEEQTATLGIGINNPSENGRKVYHSGILRSKDTGELFSESISGNKKKLKTRMNILHFLKPPKKINQY